MRRPGVGEREPLWTPATAEKKDQAAAAIRSGADECAGMIAAA